MIDAQKIVAAQLEHWPEAKQRYADLSRVTTRSLDWGKAQFNPARIVSTGAKMDARTLAERPCFLCRSNRPPEQDILEWGDYEILVNPFPIFPIHLTIPTKRHTPQSIYGRIEDMCLLARELEGLVVFYNGPRCGASAPDHMHFQAAEADLPVMDGNAPFGTIMIEANSPCRMAAEFARAVSLLPASPGAEPMINVLCRYAGNDTYRMAIIPHRRLRPSFYGSSYDEFLISPASVDLGGIVITPLEKDFTRLDAATMHRIYREVCYTPEEIQSMMHPLHGRTISVGILTAGTIEIDLKGEYEIVEADNTHTTSGKIRLEGGTPGNVINICPLTPDCRAEVKDVTIGVDFHWQRKETQCFTGSLRILPAEGSLTLINVLPVEDYLASVISSEMSATSQPELLKAHAIISRSWVIAQIINKIKKLPGNSDTTCGEPCDRRYIKWYDHDDHEMFDVCADDHCQRYQGVTRQTSPAVAEAIEATRGMVLTYAGDICDARFSKCCGGALEKFENCWQDTPKPYLAPARDAEETCLPDLSVESAAREWIMQSPDSFCNTSDKNVLRQVLNDYDRETPDFFRWRVDYTADEIADIVRSRSGHDFGRILSLEPLLRGSSGRICLLRIVGEKLTMEVGKELEIRRWLSPSHLYSSAFVPEMRADGGVTLYGAGWGHGVGLCQIGAAMMAEKGYSYQQILSHYFAGASITRLT